MMKSNNILIRYILLITLVIGCGSNVWAQRMLPSFAVDESAPDKVWHYIIFPNNGSDKIYANTGNDKLCWTSSSTVPTDDFRWYLIGNQDDFILKSVSGKYAYTTETGTGSETAYRITDNAAQATHFNLINGNNATTWAIHRKSGGNKNSMNHRSGNEIREWSVDNGSSVIFSNPLEIIKYSDVPSAGAWAANTHWFSMRNNRNNQSGHNRKYITTSAGGVADDFALLPILATKPDDLGSYWCFVGSSSGFVIQNAAYGPDFVLAIAGNQSNATVKMFRKDQVPAGYTSTFTAVDNSTIDDGSFAYAFRLGTSGNSHIHVTQGRFIVYTHSAISGGDTGSAFKLTNVPQSTIDALTAYDVYRVQWAGVIDDFTIDYAESSKIFGKRGNANQDSYLIIESGSSVDKENFTISTSAYTISNVVITPAEGHFYQNLLLTLRDKAATEPWFVKITQDEADAAEYEVTYMGNTYGDGEIFYRRPGVAPKAVDFTINAPVDKFVWGPVFDMATKMVSYDVRNLVTGNTLLTGWYQLQIAEAEVAALRDKIILKAGNINTKANTLYLAPALYASEANKIMKVTGVPQYAGEASTFVYIENIGSENYSLTSSVTGQSISGPCTFNNGVLTKFRNCSYEDTAQPLEGPFLLPTGNSTPAFKVAKADISKYTIYKVSIKEGDAAVSDVRLNISNSHVLGSTVVSDGGYLFMLKNSTVPSISQVSVTMGNVIVTSITTDVEVDGIKPITFHVATKQTMWKAVIIGDAANLETDSIIYSSNKYKSGDFIPLSESYEPTTLDLKTNVTDRFVWGPIINRDEKTVTFEIKNPVNVSATSNTPLTTDGWYQFQLIPYSNGTAFINDINSRCTGAKSRKGSYIYMFNADTEFKQNASNYYPVKFAAVPENGDQATSFLYVKANATRPQFQAINGHNIGNSGYVPSSPDGVNRLEAITAENIYGVYRWFRYDTGSDEAPYMGASGTGRNFFVRAVKVDPTTMYDVYQVNLSGIGQDKVRFIGNNNHGINEVFNNGYFFLTRGTSEPTKENFYFDGVTMIESITITPSEGKKIISFNIVSKAEGYSNTIIHRQHDVYDRISTVDDNSLPKGSYIKRGEGMIEHPMVAVFTPGNTDNDRQIQNTSIFHVTQYTKPGTRTECILPFTKGKSTGDHLRQYQRWYNYQTERPLADEIIRLDNGSSTLGNFNVFANGHSNYNLSGNRQYDVLGKADIKLPVGSTDIYVGVDASEFQDSKSLGNGNILEPSLNMRVVYHIISAHEMAKKLTTTGDTWWEAKEYFVPNIKRGSDTYKNNADLIPLDMPFSNYWFYKTLGSAGVQQSDAQLMPIVAEGGNYNTLRSNLEIVVEGTAKDYLEVGVFDGNPGNIGSAPYINSNHFLYYKVKGAGVTRTVPAGSQAVIKVYAKDGSNASSPKYQLFKFTLNFQAATEPLAITSVVGNSASTRSVDYFIQNGFKESASLTFKNKDVSFTKIPGWRNDGNEGVTYAFPIDFSRTSYGYSPSNSFGNYRITTKGYGNQFRPVSLYEHNIKNRTNTTLKSADDYFFFIDAAESPGQVASITLDGTLCVGSRLYCYGWFGSSNNYNGDGNPSGASVLLQVVGHRHDGTEEVIASYLPGTITDVSYDDEGDMMRSLSYASFPSQQASGWMDINATRVGVWNSVGFSFIVKDVDFDSYDLRIINNCFSTSGGDYVLDDFRVFVSPPKGNVDFTTPLCSDALRHVKVHTDFDMLLEAAGVNTEIGGDSIPVSFCFLNKKIYDEATKDYYDVDESGNRTLKSGIDYNSEAVKFIFNQAFGDALIGVRSIDKSVKGHAFHNFTVPVDFNNIPAYAYSESPDDQIFKEEKDNGERRIVFKEQLYQSDGSTHNWVPGESYYLLFAPFHVEAGHVTSHDVGTSTFDIASLCCVLTIFDIMPPIEVKGDATVTSSDQVKACDNQVVTFKVDMPALKLDDDGTGVSDAVISGLNYDWWIGNSKEEATYQGFYEAEFGEYSTIENARRYNHKSVDDYPDDTDVDKKVYLQSALENIRFYFPEARTLDEVTLVEFDNDNGYGIVQEHIECVRHFITPLENGRKPLSLFGQTFNLKVSHAEADGNNKQHFVAIPIIPEQEYGVNEKLIYCPAPQELVIHVADQAPNLQNGFGNVTYPEPIINVPIRIGKKQIDGVRKEADADLVGHTLNIPLRKIQVVDGSSTKLLPKNHETERFGSIYLAATDDSQYQFDTEGGEFAMRRVAQVIDLNAEKSSPEDGYMTITFTNDFPVREGCTYTLKLPYVEDVACQCEGTLVFDLIIVPEYQLWTGAAGNNDWNNDLNWRRADVVELHADKATDGPLAGYISNAENTTSQGRVPMSFTNVMMDSVATDRSVLYSYSRSTDGIAQLQTTATPFVEYDMLVRADSTAGAPTGNYSCELYHSNLCNDITFLPGGELYNAHLLTYRRAWVEYLLVTKRWHLLASPLQGTYAGEWYAPTASGRQDTPHFYPLTYDSNINNRFAPAVYQRSWDHSVANLYRIGGDGLVTTTVNPLNVGVRLDWSHVYNDVQVPYSLGGFSVKPVPLDMPTDVDTVLIRMPKDDNEYLYYQRRDPLHGDRPQTIAHGAEHHRLLTDRLRAAESFVDTLITTAGNPYLLVSNPFMTPLSLDAFLTANPDFEPAVWTMQNGSQQAHLRSDDGWVSTSEQPLVAPLESFFVRLRDTAVPADGRTPVRYARSMQQLPSAPYSLRAALCTLHSAGGSISLYESDDTLDNGNNQSVRSLVDSNTAESVSTIFFLSEGEAHAVQAVSDTVTRIPIGVQAVSDTVLTTITAHRSSFINHQSSITNDWHLLDALNGELEPITEDWSLTVRGSSFGRYFLVRRSATGQPAESNGEDELCEVCNQIYITTYGDCIAVVSSQNALATVSLVTPGGQTIESQHLPATTRETYLHAAPGVYLLQVITHPAADGSYQRRTFKIMLGAK